MYSPYKSASARTSGQPQKVFQREVQEWQETLAVLGKRFPARVNYNSMTVFQDAKCLSEITIRDSPRSSSPSREVKKGTRIKIRLPYVRNETESNVWYQIAAVEDKGGDEPFCVTFGWWCFCPDEITFDL